LVTPLGWSNSLAQKLVQLTMPGVADVYQGTELWDDSLVDPDNRRPVDFAHRASLLATLDSAGSPPPVDATGAAKLWLVSRALRLRRDRPEVFTGYRPLPARGPAADHVLAFDRGGALTVATRLPGRLARTGGWRDTTLTIDGDHTDVLTGRRLGGRTRLADLLATYPVALLVPA
jgi:(1->4)-alpha-D-glucan 1-alpha-D-glucosylmutase